MKKLKERLLQGLQPSPNYHAIAPIAYEVWQESSGSGLRRFSRDVGINYNSARTYASFYNATKDLYNYKMFPLWAIRKIAKMEDREAFIKKLNKKGMTVKALFKLREL